MPLDLFEEDAVGRDLAAQAAVGVAGDAQADGARPGVARQADEAGFVGQVEPAELGPEPGLPGQAHDPLLPAERPGKRRPLLPPFLGRPSRKPAEASLTVLRVISGEIPPTTTAMR